MGLIAVPNVSEGRDIGRIRSLEATINGAGARLADTHTDGTHNRSVFTVGGSDEVLVRAMVDLAGGTMTSLDLTRHEGVHPRLGVLDVCPIVPHGSSLDVAVGCSRAIGEAIGSEHGIPVYLYGAAAARSETRELPDLRRGGLDALRARAVGDLPPDFGPDQIDERIGVVCVGARDVLIAFNVWIEGSGAIVRSIASEVREAQSGLAGLRALGLEVDDHTSQVSMNLTRPSLTGIDAAFEAVSAAASLRDVKVVATELIGVPPERFMPDPEREAARLLRRPGRSLESALA